MSFLEWYGGLRRPSSAAASSSEGGSGVGVKRALFGRGNTEENLQFVRRELEAHRRKASERWNYDFEHDRPKEGRFEWSSGRGHGVTGRLLLRPVKNPEAQRDRESRTPSPTFPAHSTPNPLHPAARGASAATTHSWQMAKPQLPKEPNEPPMKPSSPNSSTEPPGRSEASKEPPKRSEATAVPCDDVEKSDPAAASSSEASEWPPEGGSSSPGGSSNTGKSSELKQTGITGQ